MPRFLRPLLLALTLAAPLSARARSDAPTVALTPAALGDALSCRSAAAAQAFASALFLDTTPPTWMRKAKGDKATRGMIGLYGYTLREPVDLLGQKVDRVYFLKDWVLALLPRYPLRSPRRRCPRCRRKSANAPPLMPHKRLTRLASAR